MYTVDNLVISATHTHSGPGGFMMDVLTDIFTGGFVPQTYHALLDGIFMVIKN